MEEVIGEAAVEGFAHIGLKGERMLALTAAMVVRCAAFQHGIDGATVGCRDILHVGGILQSAFDFERPHACIHHGLKVIDPAHILQREQVAIALNDAAFIVHQIESQATELGAATTVGRAVKLIGGGIAAPTVTDAQRTMDEGFNIKGWQGFVHLANTLQRTLARQDHSRESLGLSQPCVFHTAVVHLRGGMESYGGQASLGLQFGQGSVLGD